MRIFGIVWLVFFISASAVSQEQEGRVFRGSIPEELLRPARGEAPRYPADTVIGELGQGNASSAAFFFANSAAVGLLSGRMDHPALSSINSSLRESYLSALGIISPVSFRIGGGREEADGAVSFLIRFIGRDQGITGELYIRYVTRRIQREDGEVTTVGSWIFDELLLEEAKDRDVERQEASERLDYYPYERFF
jgi:hypothetical protein